MHHCILLWLLNIWYSAVHNYEYILSILVLDTNLANRLIRPKIKTSPKDHLDSISGGYLDPLLIKKQELEYKEDATTNYGLFIDK